LGDLNYRINLSNVEAKALILKKQWSKLLEKDQVPPKLLHVLFKSIHPEHDSLMFSTWFSSSYHRL